MKKPAAPKAPKRASKSRTMASNAPPEAPKKVRKYKKTILSDDDEQPEPPVIGDYMVDTQQDQQDITGAMRDTEAAVAAVRKAQVTASTSTTVVNTSFGTSSSVPTRISFGGPATKPEIPEGSPKLAEFDVHLPLRAEKLIEAARATGTGALGPVKKLIINVDEAGLRKTLNGNIPPTFLSLRTSTGLSPHLCLWGCFDCQN